jgi:peptide deformylase
MTVLKIVEYPDPVLRVKSTSIGEFNADLDRLIADMEETMMATPHAVGLSAVQVGVPVRLFLLRLPEMVMTLQPRHVSDPIKTVIVPFINPVIERVEGDRSEREGCLSFPGVFDYIQRADTALLSYDVMVNGKIEKTAHKFYGFWSVAVQHEMDHLDGKLMYDYFSRQYKKQIDKKFDRS